MRLNIGGYDFDTKDYAVSIEELVVDLNYSYNSTDEKVFGVGGDFEIDEITSGKIEYNHTKVDDTEEKFDTYNSYGDAPEWLQDLIEEELHEERVKLVEEYNTSWEE